MAELIALKSLQEAADLLGVSVFTIRRLIKAGEIRAVHVGARVLVPAAEIERVANHGVGVARVGKPRTSAKADRENVSSPSHLGSITGTQPKTVSAAFIWRWTN